jgi:hypothetical protein
LTLIFVFLPTIKVDQKPGFWRSTSQVVLAAGAFQEPKGFLLQEKPGFFAPKGNHQ